MATRYVVKSDGTGSGRCDGCNGRCDYRWALDFSDGSCGAYCSTCSAALPDAPANGVI